MTTVNLTSLEDAATYLSDRTLTDAVADELGKALQTATVLIAAELNAEFTSGSREEVFDVVPGFSDTPGGLSTPFTQPYRPSYSLSTTGSVSTLAVQYRPTKAELDGTFSWEDDGEVLVRGKDYLFEDGTGTIRLLFEPAEGPHRVRAVYTEGYATTPERLSGNEFREHLSLTGAETDLDPLTALVTGVDHKMASDAASVSLQANTPVTLRTVPPEAVGLHGVTIYATQDQPLVGEDNPLTITIKGGTDNTVLVTQTIQTPMSGMRYRLGIDPANLYSEFTVEFSAPGADTLRVSRVKYDVANSRVSHMRGSAPPALTTACALLAKHLYTKDVASRNVSEDQEERQAAKSSPVIPTDVARLLRPFRRSRVSFV